MKKTIISDKCFTIKEYMKQFHGVDVSEDFTLNDMDKMNLETNTPIFDYLLSEIEHIIENDIKVVLVRFNKGSNGYDYRLVEVENQED